MLLKDYQERVAKSLRNFFIESEKQKSAIETLDPAIRSNISYVDGVYNSLGYSHFADRPKNGLGQPYPRFCLKIPTGGGKTLLAIEAIRDYQNLFAKKRTGLVVWITHRETIYRQTIENLKNKKHIYRQWLDQCSSGKTIILEKGQVLRRQDVEENLVVLMLMIQSAGRATKEGMKLFKDSSGYIDFFPQDNQYDQHQKLLEAVPNLDCFEQSLFNQRVVKTSLGNVIRVLNPLIIVDEFHTMFSDIARETLDGLNPSMLIGLSATPRERMRMNIFIEITGRELKDAEMIKLDLHLFPPQIEGNWQEVINDIKKKREKLEKTAIELYSNSSVYIRPIALIQVERTGKDQREKGKVHSEDVREYLITKGIPAHQIAVKSSEIDEIKEKKLLSRDCEIRYIVTKEALKEGWDCSFAYILGVIPNARTESSMTQLVGRVLRQPYAKKTGISELDESYVYFTRGETDEVLNNISRGFEQEGLGDLVKNVSRESGPTGSRKIKTKIKADILKKYPESLYLPVWMVKEKNNHRPFSYDIDIKSKIDWSQVNFTKWLKDEIFPALDNKKIKDEILVDLDHKYKKLTYESVDNPSIDAAYLSRRISEVVNNAFIAHDLAQELIIQCEKYRDQNKLDANSGFVISEIIKKMWQEKDQQEKMLFDKLLSDKKLILGVSDDDKIGYSLPKENEIYPEYSETYRANLFEKSDKLSMNSLEIKVANLIDKQENVLWWVRNIAENKRWYSVKGWKKGKIRPDFITAKKNKDGSLELVYVIESKGEHLIDNADTQYKKSVFDKINSEKIEDVSFNIVRFKLNKDFKFELIGQGNEELDLHNFFNI